MPTQPLSTTHLSALSALPVKEAEYIQLPPLPRITGLAEWQQIVRDNFGAASGRPIKAYEFLCAAEQPDATYEALADSGGSESMDCQLAAALKQILNHDLRLQIKTLTQQEHVAKRILKGRQIYWYILQRFKVTDVDDDIHDFDRIRRPRMHDDNLHRCIIADWHGLLHAARSPRSGS